MSSHEVVALGTVARFAGGGTPSKAHASYWSGDIPWVSPKDMWVDEITTAEDKITMEAVQSSATNLVPKGSILCVVRSGILARKFPVALTRREVATNQDIKAIIPGNKLNSRYLFYFLKASEPEILATVTTGATVHRIGTESLKALNLPLPPLEEQRRIVAVLDEAFAAIATATANAEKGLRNADNLFRSQLHHAFSHNESNWKRGKIEEWCLSVTDCVNKTAPTVESPTPFKMIRTTNVRNGRIDLSSVRYVSEATYRAWTRRQKPQRGDVILTREAPMGEVGMILCEDQVFLGQRLVSYRPIPEKLDNQFLLFALQSDRMQRQIKDRASGSTVQHMRVPDTKSLLFAAPGLDAQRRISAQLLAVQSGTDRLKVVQREKLLMLDDLKQSLLHRAFSGELTGREPLAA